MLTFGWGEILLVFVVVIVVVGPKDLPKLIKQLRSFFPIPFWFLLPKIKFKIFNINSIFLLKYLFSIKSVKIPVLITLTNIIRLLIKK